MITKDQFDRLFPLACEWAEQQEAFILQHGIPLTDDQQIDAYLIGVKEISKVRLLKVDKIPIPTNPDLQTAVRRTGLITSKTIGITFRYGIYIRSDFWNNRKLVIHELTHCMQYERLGGIEPFLDQYLQECLTVGYPNGPLEQEARRMEQEIKFQ